jgi:peptidoglycan hydrolase-like protein with peptidoglycan-binding domain
MKIYLFLFVLFIGIFITQESFAATLRVGLKSNTEVMNMQQQLKTLGFYSGAIDGNFGQGTKRALMNFQLKNNLIADGVAGIKTQKILSSNVDTEWVALCADGKPHVKITNPSGGEVYKPNQRISVDWKTCNLKQEKDTSVTVGLYNKEGEGADGFGLSPDHPIFTDVTLNDGHETYRIPSSKYLREQKPNLKPGTFHLTFSIWEGATRATWHSIFVTQTKSNTFTFSF